MRLTRRTHLSLALLAAAALYIALTALALQRAATDTGIVYALDDVYIHMALAKNLALHGVWGVTPWETTNASSSPLWVAILTVGFVVGGIAAWLPLLLAGLSSLLVLAVALRCLRAASDDTRFATAIGAIALLSIVVFASLPALTLQGMEHPLHAALMLAAAFAISRLASGGALPSLVGYALLIAALPLLRYESLWLVALGAAVLAMRRRYTLAALTLACGILPIIGFGLWAMTHGQTFLPAAILTKSLGPAWLAHDDLRRLVARFTWHPLQRIWSVPVLLVLWLAACGVLAIRLAQLRQRILASRWLVLLGLFADGTWIHATFATFGWGGRYEAYLIVLGIVGMACWVMQGDERRAIAALLAKPAWRIGGIVVVACLSVAFVYTGGARLWITTRNAIVATEEVRDRDLFVAHFLADAFPQQSVMAMNVGAIAWTGEPHLTDVLALGSPEVLRLFLRGQLDPASLDRIAAAREVKVATIFDAWFAEWTGGPAPWIAVAEIDPQAQRKLNYTLYARTDADARVLAERLKAYRPQPQFRSTIRLLPPFQ